LSIALILRELWCVEVCGWSGVAVPRVRCPDNYVNVADRLMPGDGSCPAEHHSSHNKDEAVESHTIAIIIRFSSRIDIKVMRSICTI
jgi:hypothetical protein